MDGEILPIILILLFLLVLGLVVYLNNIPRINEKVRKKVWEEVLQIKKMVDTNNPLTYRDIIIRLDSLLNKSLRMYYKNSENCGTNLKQAKSLFNKEEYNRIWEVHKLRNKVVHEDKEISSLELKNAYNIISLAIKKILYEK